MIEFLQNFISNVWESILDLIKLLAKIAIILLICWLFSLFNCSGSGGDFEVHRAGFGDM